MGIAIQDLRQRWPASEGDAGTGGWQLLNTHGPLLKPAARFRRNAAMTTVRNLILFLRRPTDARPVQPRRRRSMPTLTSSNRPQSAHSANGLNLRHVPGGAARAHRGNLRDVSDEPMTEMRYTKSKLPQRICAACGRPFAWRKKWKRDWDNVKTCSERCKWGLRRRAFDLPKK